jgi:hypothetical protein
VWQNFHILARKLGNIDCATMQVINLHEQLQSIEEQMTSLKATTGTATGGGTARF